MIGEPLSLNDAMPARQLRARWVVCGTLRLETAMHLGGTGTERVDMPVLRDAHDGGPLLPGTTFAGALRNALADRLAGYGEDEADAVSALFGGVRGDDDGIQSPLIVFDAPGRLAEGHGIEIRDGVAISTKSGTAENHKKYDYEVLPAGTTFSVRVDLLIPAGTEEKPLVESLGSALDALSHGETAFGAKRSRGLGGVTARWAARRFDLNSRRGWLAWVQSDHEDPVGVDVARVAPRDALSEASPDDLLPLSFVGDVRRRVVLDLNLTVRGDILVRSPGSAANDPDVGHLKSGSAPILPGTSLAGVLRAHALRIARLVRHQHRDADRWIERLFGPRFEGRRPPPGLKLHASRLRVGEAVIEKSRSRRQTRIAIDRFTQGVIPTSLFDEQVEVGGSARVRLALQNPEAGELGLVLLVLKDLLGGKLSIGGTSAIGRGVLAGSAVLTFHDGSRAAPRTASIKPESPPSGEAADRIGEEIQTFHTAASLNEGPDRTAGMVEGGGRS